MSKTSRRRNVQDIADTLATIASTLRKAEDVSADELHGQIIRSSSTDNAGTGGKGGHSDPTATIATRDAKARDDERNVDRDIANVAKKLRGTLATLMYWTTDIPAKAEELAKLERDADPGCEIMATVLRQNGPPFWEPVFRTSDLNGLLPRPYALGRWAYDFVGLHDRLPTQAERVAHSELRRVMVTA